jgi:shikimate kinase
VIVLIGFMGAGKTSVGRLLAARLGVAFRDADAELVARAGRSIAQLFAADGEAAFRALEREVIAGLLAGSTPAARDGVLSLGGGALGEAATRAALREHATTVLLDVHLDEALRRVGANPGRPMLARPDLPELFAARRVIYRECADLTVTTANRSAATVAALVATALGAAA